MSAKEDQYDGRLYTQPEVDRMVREARIDELERTVFAPMHGKTWLDIRPDIELSRQAQRLEELKSELSKEDV